MTNDRFGSIANDPHLNGHSIECEDQDDGSPCICDEPLEADDDGQEIE